MIGLFGYLDAWSATPGSTVTAHLSSRRCGEAQVDLVALGQGTERMEEGGTCFERVVGVTAQSVDLAWQGTDAGSYATIHGLGEPGVLPEHGTLALLFQPWEMPGRDGVLVEGGQGEGALRLGVDGDWRVFMEVGGRRHLLEVPLVPRRWYAAVFEWHGGRAEAVLHLLSDHGRSLGRTACVLPAAWSVVEPGTALILAGRRIGQRDVGGHFNGRIEHPAILSGGIDADALLRWLRGVDPTPPGPVVAWWDFSRGIDTAAIEDCGPRALHGVLHNLPKRGVRGARWSGACLDWRQCPADYAAIHFHEDDLIDANWSPSVRLALPADLRSGAYAVRVQQGDESLLLPLFVRAREPGRQARVAVVFPTYTYLAYANDHTLLHGNGAEVLASRAIALEPADLAMAEHPEWGLSLYDTHIDGSGVTLSSRWRPIPTFAPDQRGWQAGEGSGRWNYPADMLLVAWLNREGLDWEALTDEDIDRDGATLLGAYDLVLTGNHPEYATPAMVDAYRSHVARGGRLMYLGGNGFYWKVGSRTDLPGVIELRRAEDGNRSWAEEPAEYFHQLDGSYGGLWRRSGLPPQSWLGVGYSGQGFRRSTGYRRAPDGALPEVAFVFKGVSGECFGERGVIGGGCAGIEVDRADELLGSPREGYLLASSLPLDETYFMANEELLVTRPTIAGRHAPTVRSDMFVQVNDAGGAVFSTGSIAWIGGLSLTAGDPGVQRITRNVIDRFLEARPLAPRVPLPGE